MDRSLTHDEITELLAAFALDAVEPDEAEAIEAHLRTCPRCREEVLSLQGAAAALATSGGEAPPGVWDGIAARIEPPPTASPAPPRLVPRLAAERRRRSPVPPRVGAALAAAAAVAAIAILGAETAHLNHRVNQAVSAASNQGLTGAAQAALLDPQAQRIVLDSTGGQPEQVAEIVAQPSGTAFVFNRGLHPLAAEKTYQLWAVHGSQPVSLGLLGRDPTTVALHLGPATSGTAYAVTVERAGGAVAPTSAPVASTPA